jgi:hypothetical protein
MKLGKKLMSLSCVSAILASSCITAFAANNANFYGYMLKGNPITSAPWASATTHADYDTNTIRAKIEVYNSGSLTKSSDTGNLSWTNQATTAKVYGSTYASAGTKFLSYYWGTDFDSSPTSWSSSSSYTY